MHTISTLFVLIISHSILFNKTIILSVTIFTAVWTVLRIISTTLALHSLFTNTLIMCIGTQATKYLSNICLLIGNTVSLEQGTQLLGIFCMQVGLSCCNKNAFRYTSLRGNISYLVKVLFYTLRALLIIQQFSNHFILCFPITGSQSLRQGIIISSIGVAQLIKCWTL